MLSSVHWYVAQMLCIELCPSLPTLFCVVMPMLLAYHQAVVLLATHRVLQHSGRRGEGRHLAEHNAPEHWGHAYCRRECALGLLGRGMNDSGLRWHTPTCVHCFYTCLCSSCVFFCVLLHKPKPALVCTVYCFNTSLCFRAGRWEMEGG